MASVLPFVRGVDFSRNVFEVCIAIRDNLGTYTLRENTRVECTQQRSCWQSATHYHVTHKCTQDGRFVEKVLEMSNLRWLRLNRTDLTALPEDVEKFSKLVRGKETVVVSDVLTIFTKYTCLFVCFRRCWQYRTISCRTWTMPTCPTYPLSE